MVQNGLAEEIVVIDDDLMSLKLTRRIFEKAGMRGAYFSSGSEALEYFKSAPCPDIILLDVYMPEVNGFAVLKQLKEDPIYGQVPVVFLTGDEDIRTETAGLHAGAADFIRKPFAAEILIKRVRNIIELNRLHNDMASEIRAAMTSFVESSKAKGEILIRKYRISSTPQPIPSARISMESANA